ncbi:MAG: SPASM domain-containing protein [Sedimentisphaerales bacterium]|nr:SPASM domain-containing protein [Sedimentisphaerales bacterium]
MSDKKNAVLIYADLERSELGTSSHIADKMGGVTVLERTLRRCQQAGQVDEVIVFCPYQQQERIYPLINQNERILVYGLKEPVPVSKWIRWRKWALTSWRGGIHETTQFDESSFTPEMVDYARQRQIYTAVCVSSAAVLIDPDLIDGLLHHHHSHGDDMRFTFTQAAPGLCGCAYRLDLLHELVQAGTCVGKLLAYNPDAPRADSIMQECNYSVNRDLYTSPFRYLADTQRTCNDIKRFIEHSGSDMDEWDAARIIREMAEIQHETDTLPWEVEIEINTLPSLRINGYPHRRYDLNREPMPFELFEKIVSQFAEYDDICLTFGGIGEPLAHPELMNMVVAAKSAGIFGINIETDGKLLNGKLAQDLLDSEVDTLSVFLDADEKNLYQLLKEEDCFDKIVMLLEDFIAKSQLVSGPLVIPHLVKTRETMVQMESFYDRWLRQCGCAVITGFNDFAGQIENQAVMNMAPPKRFPCRRLNRYMTIHSDANVTICDQDFLGRHTIGNLTAKSIKQLWLSEEMEQLRKDHVNEKYENNLLCAGCKEWHR